MYAMSHLSKLGTLGKASPAAMQAFQDLSAAAFADGELPPKVKELIAVAVAVSKQCVYCMEAHRNGALKAGASEQEIAEAVFVASAIGAGAALTHGTHVVA